MSVARSPARMSRDAFLAWDATQQGRHEFDGHGPVAMVGGTAAHSRIKTNLYRELAAGLRGTRCEVFDCAMRNDAAGSIRHPDATVSCTPLDSASTWVREPVIVFEVISPGTASVDYERVEFGPPLPP